MNSFLKKISEELGHDIAKRLQSLGVDSESKFELFKSANDTKELTKISYPSYGNDFMYKEYQMDKWEIAFKKYIMFRRLKYSDAKIENFFKKSTFEDKEELNKFLQWSKAKESSKDMYKLASYGFGIVPNSHTDPSIYSLPGSSFRPTDPQIEKAKSIKDEKAKKENKTRRTIQRSLNSLMRALQSSEEIDYDTYERASELLFALMNVFKKRYASNMQKDAIIRTSSAFRKMGLKDEFEVLNKLAQEIPVEEPALSEEERVVPQPPPQVEPAGQVATPQPGVTQEEPPVEEKEEAFPEVDPVDIRSIKAPGPSKSDYNSFNLEGVTIEDAAKKLDDVAATLADRRVIRMLAEFDIMLDSLGIASMFPELAESQSKLIDSFSYALTRVSKMMGQISQARNLIDAADKIPGSETVRDMVSEDESEAEQINPEEEISSQVPPQVPPSE